MVDLSQRREGRWGPIEANGNGVECFVPPCAPLYAPLHHQPLLFVLILTSWSTPPAHLLCQLRHNPLDLYRTVSALDLCGTRSKSRSLQMGEFRAARLAGALFELVQLELCKLSWAGNREAIFSWVGSASSGRHWTDLKRPWQVNQVRMVNQQEVYVQGCFCNSNQIKDNIFTQRKRPKRVSCKSTDTEF